MIPHWGSLHDLIVIIIIDGNLQYMSVYQQNIIYLREYLEYMRDI